jgi:hypothetical protein
MTEHDTQNDTAQPAGQPLCAPAPIDKLAAALAKAQAKMTNPPKTRHGQYRGGRYMYTDLADVLDHVRGPLSENGLAIVQIIQPGMLVTRLVHASGQYVESLYPLPVGQVPPQEMGGAITYARRYSLCPLLGISGETDDDAQAATEAAETAEMEQKRKAAERLEELKAKGKLRSAHDGHLINPGEDTDKPLSTETPGPADPPAPPPSQEPPKGASVTIDPRLDKQLKRDGITIEQLKAFAVSRNYIKAEMDMSKLEEGFIKACLDTANWKKVIASTKGAQ